ncbi:hypothetical protein Tsubulata_021161 [Turnera subulata]|uniref:Uncharacterized protein n=1 Tax=Turnera subulata TaxID=218843 RepID=A0A9Q0GFU1_9ROSI|nr:hypothetical protein Tsubulata_021161 [Turnera subulata]
MRRSEAKDLLGDDWYLVKEEVAVELQEDWLKKGSRFSICNLRSFTKSNLSGLFLTLSYESHSALLLLKCYCLPTDPLKNVLVIWLRVGRNPRNTSSTHLKI